ncbi:MAG: hypothetical protein O2800_07160 [Planctomycetota bacterium]|nr:hypothetical protein [Planctomycetota bacterium]
MRVVSLVPSATELLCAIGGEHLLVGQGHECDGDAIRALNPDVILTHDGCDVGCVPLDTVRAIAATMNPPPRILSLNPTSLWDVFDDLLRVGHIVDRDAAACAAMTTLRDRAWTALDRVTPFIDGPKVLFLGGIDPPRAGGQWIPELITLAGGTASLSSAGTPSRVVAADEIVASAPTGIIIAPCGFSVESTRAALSTLTDQPWWSELPAVRASGGILSAADPSDGPTHRSISESPVVLIDGQKYFHRPSPRLVDCLEWLVEWCSPRPR